MRLGVDLGTTWTAAAVHASTGPEAVQLADRTIAMPSVVAIDQGTVLVGEAAEAHLAQHPAAGAREFKRRLGDSAPYVLDGTPYGAEALMGHLLRHTVDRAETQVGEAVEELALTHPANWGQFKLDLLREAARLADVEDRIVLLPEPVAAVRHHLALGGIRPGQVVAAFDVGGGTVDVAIVRSTTDGAEVLGRPEGLERLGGVDVDHLVLAHVDAVLDGQLRELDATDPDVRAGVARLRLACVAAKEALSSETETTIPVRLPGLDTEVRMARTELEAALRPRLDDAVGALRRAVGGAGIGEDELEAVVLVGGTSRIPLVGEAVASAVGAPTIPGADPELAIAAGAAVASGAARADATDAPTAEDVADAAASPGRESTRRPRGEGSTDPERRRTLRKLVSVGAAGATTAAVGVGGYLAYRRWWDGDDEQQLAADELPGDVGLPADDELSADDVEAISDAVADQIEDAAAFFEPPALDEFDAGPGPADVGTAATNDAGGGGSPASFSAASTAAAPAAPADSRAATFAGQPRPARPNPTNQEPAVPTAARPDIAAASATESTVLPPILSDPELEAVRDQLRDRLGGLELPEGTSPEDADRLRRDLDGLLDRFRAAPGQSVDEAVAALRYEFEDRMRDFAQDQRIDALIEEAREDEPVPADQAPPETPAEPPEDPPPVPDPVGSDAPTDSTIPTDVFDEVVEADEDGHDGDEDRDDTAAPAETEDVAQPVEDAGEDDAPTIDDVGGPVSPTDGSDAPSADDELGDEVGDDVLGTDPVDPVEGSDATDPLILTEPGAEVPEAPPETHAANPDDGRLTRDLIPEVVGAEPPPAEETFQTAIVPGGEFYDPADEPAVPTPVVDEATDDLLDDPLGV